MFAQTHAAAHSTLNGRQHDQPTAAPSILSPTAAQSLLDGLTTPHASEYIYKPPHPGTPAAPRVISGLGFHVVPPRQAPPLPPPPPQQQRESLLTTPPVLPVVTPTQPLTDVFSPSIYSTSSPDSSPLQSSPSTDSLPSPVFATSDDLHPVDEDALRAWPGSSPEWRADDHDSPAWAPRWGRRNDSTVSDSLWASADGSEQHERRSSSLFSTSLGSAGGSEKDAFGLLGTFHPAPGQGRRLSTGSSAVDQLDGAFPAAPAPAPTMRASYSRGSDSSVGSLFRFAGPATNITTTSQASSPPLEADGWDDLSNAILDEVHGGYGGRGRFQIGSYQSYSRFSTRHPSSDSAFAFDEQQSLRRSSAGSSLAGAPPTAFLSLQRRVPIVDDRFFPVANAGAELMNRKHSAGSFSGYQIRRASYERRTSVGTHPLVASVDPLTPPALENEHQQQRLEERDARRVSTASELEREERLAFLMDLQRRVSQVVEVRPGGRQYAVDQWELDKKDIHSTWSPSTVASEDEDVDMSNGSSFSPRLSPINTDSAASTPALKNVASPRSLHETLQTNLNLTFSFEERLSPFSSPMPLPPAADEDGKDSSFAQDDQLPDISPTPLVSAYALAHSASAPAFASSDGAGRPFTAFSDEDEDDDDDEELNGATDLEHGEQLTPAATVEIATLRKVALRTASIIKTPPAQAIVAFEDRPLASPASPHAPEEAFDMAYLADMVRILPTPQPSLNAAVRRGSQPALSALATKTSFDEFAAAFPPPAASSTASQQQQRPLARKVTPTRLRAVQSMSSFTPEQLRTSPQRRPFDRMATFLSTSSTGLGSAAGESDRSISPLSQPSHARGNAAGRRTPSRAAKRNAGSWELPWGAQLARSSVSSGTGAVEDTPAAPVKRPTYVSATVPPCGPSAKVEKPAATKAEDGGNDPRRPSTSSSSALPFHEVFVRQTLAERRDSVIKLHLAPADLPARTQQPQHPMHGLPDALCYCGSAFKADLCHASPLPHPRYPAPRADERARSSDPVLAPFASRHATVHPSSSSASPTPPVRFAVPRKQAPEAPRPPLPPKAGSAPAIAQAAAAAQTHEVKKRRSRAVFSRLFASKKDKAVAT